MNGAPQPSGLRFVTCMTCEATVIQHLDDHDEWRPKPPLCDACKAEGARQTAEWQRQAHPLFQSCPCCSGTGLTSRPPWIAGDQLIWTDSSAGPYPCKRCGGTGTIATPASEAA